MVIVYFCGSEGVGEGGYWVGSMNNKSPIHLKVKIFWPITIKSEVKIALRVCGDLSCDSDTLLI